jgi:hypothetical protein
MAILAATNLTVNGKMFRNSRVIALALQSNCKQTMTFVAEK